jgi:predicted ester cyclase
MEDGMTSHFSARRSEIELLRVDIAQMMFREGWGANAGWQDVWKAHATEDMVGYFHGDPNPNQGRVAFLAFQAALFEGFPKLETHITATIVEGDTVIVQSLLSGAHTGDFLGIPASHKDVAVPDVTIFRFEGDKISEVRYFTDLLRVMQTIGAVAPVPISDDALPKQG